MWNETFKFLVRRSQQKYNVEFDLYDYDWNTKDDFMGSTTFDVSLVMEVSLSIDYFNPVTENQQRTN